MIPYAAGNADSGAAQADLAAGRARLKAEQESSLRYADDAVSRATPGATQRATGFRTATAQCPKCGSKCEIHQEKSVSDGAWVPNETQRLAAFGWQAAGGQWFCGKWCLEMWVQQTRAHGTEPIKAVTRVNDASYARKMYATDPKQVTPAAPPRR